MNNKEKFIEKWSCWWAHQKEREQLNEAFRKELEYLLMKDYNKGIEDAPLYY